MHRAKLGKDVGRLLQKGFALENTRWGKAGNDAEHYRNCTDLGTGLGRLLQKSFALENTRWGKAGDVLIVAGTVMSS